MVERNATSELCQSSAKRSLLHENGSMYQCLMSIRPPPRIEQGSWKVPKTPAYRHQHFQWSSSMAKISLRSGLSFMSPESKQ